MTRSEANGAVVDMRTKVQTMSALDGGERGGGGKEKHSANELYTSHSITTIKKTVVLRDQRPFDCSPLIERVGIGLESGDRLKVLETETVINRILK